jgi:1-acyl-sn-glycerol-3-phosphate acyltransferase
MKPVDRYSIGYELARTWVRFTFKNLFYRSWKLRGLENIDFSKPILFAANHQNALMDALHLVLVSKAQPIFLARADIFKKKPIARILNWMKIMPVYRIRDGFDSLQKNDEIFQKCAKILAKGSSMVIFPEGNHGSQRNLRILKKGLARVAFGAEKATDFTLGLQVVPVGIDYSDYEKFRTRVTISIGNPIAVSQFKADFEEDVQKGYRALNDAIRVELEPHMIEIPWNDMYEGVMDSRTIFGKEFAEKNGLPYQSTFNKFDSDKKFIETIAEAHTKDPEQTVKTFKKIATYFKLLKRSKLRDHIPANAPYGFFKLFLDVILLIIASPIFLYGFLNHFLAFFVPDKLSRTLIKDRQFRSSVAYVLAFVVILPLTYLILGIVAQVIYDTWWITLVYLITLVPFGIFAIHYSFFFKKTIARIAYMRQLRRKNSKLMKILEIRSGILEELRQIIA